VAVVLDLIIRCVSVSALLTIIPGPNTLVVLRSAVRDRSLAVLAALGTSAGALTWGVAAAVGLAVFLRRFAGLYEAVKLAGACYLILLGAATIWSTVSHRPIPGPRLRRRKTNRENEPGRLTAFQAGYASDVLNPKTGIFYVAIVPQIIPARIPASAGILLFSGLDAAVTAAWFTFIAVCVAQLSLRLLRPRVIRIAERITGVVLIGLGVRTVLESS
jgi:threonine/homoserine/homoserine lactone efflux protein